MPVRSAAPEHGPTGPHPAAGGTAIVEARACFAPPAEADRDGDRLDDGCELALARAFAPALVFESAHCGWDGEAQRPAAGYLFGVEPTGSGAGVRIVYLPAYVRDCGWSGPKCALLRAMCEGHSGDSETIAVEVEPADAERWYATAAFLSAHCFGDGACRCHRGAELEPFRWVGGAPLGAPVVWVARGTHANYRSAASCDGHRFFDSCDQHDVTIRFPIVSNPQNVGRRARPFRGWTSEESGDAPTPYDVQLREVLAW